MGRDKGLIEIGEYSNFLKKTVRRIGILTEKVYVSLRVEQISEYSKYLPSESLIVDADIPVKGPLKGILSSWKFLEGKGFSEKSILFLPVDMPFVRIRTLKRLLDSFLFEDSGVFYRSKTGIEPICGIYSSHCLSDWFRSFETDAGGEFSLQKRLAKMTPKILTLPSEEEVYFRNINTGLDL